MLCFLKSYGSCSSARSDSLLWGVLLVGALAVGSCSSTTVIDSQKDAGSFYFVGNGEVSSEVSEEDMFTMDYVEPEVEHPPEDVAFEEQCVSSQWFLDVDNDGYGTDDYSVQSCDEMDGYSLVGGDCDDGDPKVYPGAQEVCDETDNDCDGYVDNGITCADCEEGDTQSCGDTDLGECAFGVQTCNQGIWGLCIGALLPKDEVCDGQDNDCDGQVDEICGCDEGDTQTCGVNTGECQTGLMTCTGGEWSGCVGEIAAQPEECDGKDNDCDGETDEDCECTNGQTLECGSDAGGCQKGTQTCSNGQWGLCEGEVTAKPEVCDGKDNDCDGQTDEECGCSNGETVECGSNVGECQKGTQTCSNGQWGSCVGEVTAKPEACDGKDNDCDNQTDEGCDCLNGETKVCGTDVGECQSGTQTCSNGAWGSCIGDVGEKPEVCDGEDNDCDNQTDEGCDCLNGETKECGTDVGECQKGTQTCSNGQWGSCIGEVTGKPEVCDGKDNNCNNQTDEGCDCVNGDTKQCGSDVGQCQAGTQTCSNGQWGSCIGEVTGSPEICDGKDNDCDNSTDEGNVCLNCIASDQGASLCLLDSFDMPSSSMQGVTWDSGNQCLWVMGLQLEPGAAEGNLYKVNANNGQVLQSFTVGGDSMLVRDITYDGQFLWLTTVFPNQFLKYSTSVQLLETISMKNGELPSGLARFGNYFLVVGNADMMSPFFHIWKYTGGTSFTKIADEPCPNIVGCYLQGMTEGMGNVWSLQGPDLVQRSSNFGELDRFVLQGDVLENQPMGVAWDGTHFWVTETTAGKLHKFAYVE